MAPRCNEDIKEADGLRQMYISHGLFWFVQTNSYCIEIISVFGHRNISWKICTFQKFSKQAQEHYVRSFVRFE